MRVRASAAERVVRLRAAPALPLTCVGMSVSQYVARVRAVLLYGITPAAQAVSVPTEQFSSATCFVRPGYARELLMSTIVLGVPLLFSQH